MILLLSGEGSGDLGSCQTPTGIGEGTEFKPGPMAWFVDKLVEPHWGYSPMTASSYIFISESALASQGRNSTMGMSLPGKKKALGTAYFHKNARCLARLAKERSARDKCPVGAVLFRDCDGTLSDKRTLWNDKINSIERGFQTEAFDLGVPMVPKPKSEAWLLCAVQGVPYQNCARFEELSGNDASPNSAKGKLEQALAAKTKGYADVCDMIKRDEINPQRITMPSFHHFRERLETVARRMLK